MARLDVLTHVYLVFVDLFVSRWLLLAGMNSRLALLCVALAAALASVSARELECEVCRKVSGVVEAVLKQNASATSTFTQVATALCDHVPEGMYEQVRSRAVAARVCRLWAEGARGPPRGGRSAPPRWRAWTRMSSGA